MAEVLGTVGTAIGMIGFVGQLFDGCVKAYGYFTMANNLDADSQRMMCKVRIEEMRLVVWGREWGVAEGKFDEHLSERNPQLRVLATQILEQLHGTVTDFKKLQDRYGLVDEAAGKGGKEADVSPPRKGSKDEGKKTNGSKTTPDKDKFANLLKDLKDFNDVQSFQRAWTHQLLDRAQRDLAELSLLENASSGIYPQLTNSANLKKLRINLDSKPQASFKPTFALKIGRTSLDIQDLDSPRRVQAHHVTAGDVLIEWVDYDREEIEERVAHVRRMDDLARMMHSASECHPDLHSIDCLGYTDDAANNRYGLVYKAPSSSHSTLKTLISSPDLKTPDLDDRIRLAQTLAVAVWSLHSLDWLHKSLCSSNIVFFPSAFSTSGLSPTASAALVPDISLPYLSGFGASRPELDTALSIVPRNPSIEDLHRHPASLRGRPHIKPFDIYSFGLVLLEIGLWKVLQTYYKAHYSAERWRDKVVLAVLVPGLGSKIGKRYREVVEMCLRVDEEMSSSEAGELMEEVVNKLESIRV
ncbi:hypothetical protein TrVFT333_008640 [Trichoderma virens FT-333]|nr:hypothetical protein TrVFT333_008640 [Trichoderma virens FT-333]